jgi:hypothetical protein
MIDSHTGTGRAAAIDPAYRMTPSYTEALVNPGGVFRHPEEIVEHPWFTHEEKRTVLLSWARDELVLEQVANRSLPELKPKSRLDAVIEALSRFDASAASEYRAAADAIRARHRYQPLRRVSRFKVKRA